MAKGQTLLYLVLYLVLRKVLSKHGFDDTPTVQLIVGLLRSRTV